MSAASKLRFSSSSDVDDRAYVNPTWSERLQQSLELPILYYIGVSSFIRVVLGTLISQPAAIFNLSDIRSRAFGKAWLAMAGADPTQGPLKSMVPLLGTASGVVLEIGPGDGRQIKFFTNPGITAIYGPEPCVPLHGPLKKAAAQAGLGDKYHVIECGGERKSLVPKLKEIGLLDTKEEPVFDTIISSKVLCGIPDLEDTVENLYDLLKPGGRIITCEHFKNKWRTPKGSLFGRGLQIFFTFIGWTFFMGGCHLNKNSGDVLKHVADKDGGWEKINLDMVIEWGSIPWVFGELVKKS